VASLITKVLGDSQYNGTMMNAFLTGLLRRMTPCLVIKKMMAPKPAEMAGAIPQAAKTCETPLNDQFTPFVPAEAIPTPMTPPIIECVVETGMVNRVAMVR
jgi:hypothetical protein